MNTLTISLKNIRKNLSFYALYLFSTAFVITVFFSFLSFSMNDIIVEKISSDGRVESMCRTISIFLMAFVIFYMTYSNRFFLRRRTEELGIYALLGYRRTSILALLCCENVFLCTGALLLGLFFGSCLYRGIVLAVTALLDLNVDPSGIPFFAPRAAAYTAGFLLVVILLLSASNASVLLRTSLIGLVRCRKKAEKRMKFHRLPAVTGLAMTGAGYLLALDILRGEDSIWITSGFYLTGMITLSLVVCGTVLFISAFLPFLLNRERKDEDRFYTPSRIILIPGFIYRIRSGARTLIMLSLLSAAALTVSSVMALSLYYPVAALSRITPSEIEFRVTEEDEISEARSLVMQYTSDPGETSFLETDIYTVSSGSPGEYLPAEYSLGTTDAASKSSGNLRVPGFECISVSSHRALLKAQGREKAAEQVPALKDNECILIKYEPNRDGSSEAGRTYSLQVGSEEIAVTVKETSMENSVSFANSVGTLIVSDDLFRKIDNSALPCRRILSVNGNGVRDSEQLYSALNHFLEGSPYLQGHSHRQRELLSVNSSTFLLIGFLVVLFFIASGSILYFNNLTAVSDNKSDYRILWEMGYSRKRIRRIIRRQVLVFFAIPFLFGLLDCIFASLVYKNALMQNLLGNSLLLYLPVLLAVLMTGVIYLIYWLITVHACCRAVFTDSGTGRT